MTRQQFDDLTGYIKSQIGRLCGLTASIATALIADNTLVAEPWHHRLVVIGIVGATISAWAVRPFDHRDDQGNLPPHSPLHLEGLMSINWHRFAEIVKVIAPIVLVAVNPALGPIASVVGHAIAEAEQVPGATGAEKAAHVQAIVAAVAPAIPGVDAAAVNESLQEGIDTVVAAAKAFKK